MKKEKCAALVYVPELTPEDVFSHLVCHHADVVRARNAQRAYKRQVERKRRWYCLYRDRRVFPRYGRYAAHHEWSHSLPVIGGRACTSCMTVIRTSLPSSVRLIASTRRGKPHGS